MAGEANRRKQFNKEYEVRTLSGRNKPSKSEQQLDNSNRISKEQFQSTTQKYDKFSRFSGRSKR